MRLRSLAFSSLLALPFMACVSGCSAGSDGGTFYDTNPGQMNYGSSEMANEAIANWHVTCRDASDCPESVGQLVTVQGAMVEMCTATLVGPDLVLTNSHCFGEHGEDPQDLCDHSVIVFADQSTGGREVAQCKTFLTKSVIDLQSFTHPDYALFRLDKPLTRKSLSVVRAGLPDRATFKIVKVDPIKIGNGGGLMKTDRCEVIHGTVLRPEATSNGNPVEITKGCEIIPGNSGSPLLNANGDVVGVEFGTREADRVGALFGDATKKSIEQETATQMPGFATNATCIDFDFAGQPPASQTCQEPQPGAVDPQRAQHLMDNLLQQVQSQIVDADPRFGYDFVSRQSDDSTIYVEYRPVCLRSLADWDGGRSSLLGFLKSDKVKGQVSIHRWQMEAAVDDDLQTTVLATSPEMMQLQFEFSFKSLKSTGKTASTVAEYSFGTLTALSAVEVWPLCAAKK